MSTVITENQLYVVIDKNIGQCVYYEGRYLKLSFSLAYELYSIDPENREIHYYNEDAGCIGRKLRKQDIKEERKYINDSIEKYFNLKNKTMMLNTISIPINKK